MSLPSTVARASWVPIIAALLLLLVLAVSSLLRAHTIPDAIPPFALILTAGLAVALSVRQRAINRELSSDIRVAHQRLGLALEAGKAVAWDWDVKSGRDIWFGDLKTMFGISGDLCCAGPATRSNSRSSIAASASIWMRRWAATAWA